MLSGLGWRLFWIVSLIAVIILFEPSLHISAETNLDIKNEYNLNSFCETPDNSMISSQVWIHIPQKHYASSLNIDFYICNNNAHAIVVTMACNPFELQNEQAVWLVKNLPCADETLTAWQIAPYSNLHISLIPKGDVSVASNIVASVPVKPIIYQGDLRDLPPPPVWQPGDPVREVPKGGVPPIETDLTTQIGEVTFMRLTTDILKPGNYRIVVRYTGQHTTENSLPSTVYSENFAVSDE